HQPYELKRQLFAQESPRRYYSREADSSYALPRGYEVDESPPPPAGVALNKVRIEESWERFSKTRAIDYGLAAGWITFNIDASAHLGSELRSEQESFYGIRSSFVALWSVYVEDPSRPSLTIDTADLPVPYAPEHRRVYSQFFERWGTHFVKRAWVGGKAEVLFSVAKSSAMTREEINSGLRASFGLPSGSAGRQLERCKHALLSHSQCTVLGRGGDELKLAALSTLDDVAYNAWLETIKNNPQTVELGVAGIWSLIPDAALSQALMDAYAAIATFPPLSSIFTVDDTLYFTRGRTLHSFDLETRRSAPPQLVVERWPELQPLGFDRIDAAFTMPRAPGDERADKLFLLRRDEVVRIDLAGEKVDAGYPRKIAEEWPGVAFEKVDAVVAPGPEALFFFAGNKYSRFNLDSGALDPGYPDLVPRRWLGVTFDRIDAATNWHDGKIYFFRGDHCIRYDPVTL
ncbi:MAG: hypothetical protein KC431_25065, partial [Myxococcales bacterium]|nr:hypothetical protein [Myxococcales bacterium]